jgi:transglycosylase-like protein with SLT domain
MRRAVVWLLATGLALPTGAQDQPFAPPASEAPAAETPATEQSPPAAEPDKPADNQAPEEPVKPVIATDAQKSICLLVESAALTHGLPVEFFARVIWQESRFRANAVGPMTRSGRRAQGIAQFMPGTAAERNLLNPFDPIQALPKSAEFLRDLRRQFGNLGLAAAAYNAGPRRVREWLAGTGPMPSETRNYVHAITGSAVEQWAKGGDKGSETADRKQQGGPDCGILMATLKRAPNPFVAALEQRIVAGAMQPWGVIVGADISRPRMLSKYAELQQRHAAVLAGRDPILLDRGRVLLRYQVRIGAGTRAEADALCVRIHKSGGDCVVLRNPRA